MLSHLLQLSSRVGFTALLLVSCGTFFLAEESFAGGEIQLASQPALSPDGSEVAFSYAGDIWTIPIKGGTAQRLTIHTAREQTPLYSPDGTAIAFVSDRSGSRQVYRMERESQEIFQLTSHTEGYLLEDWHPSGDSLLTYAVRDHHWRRPQRMVEISASERGPEKILFDAYAQAGRWSPDGSKLLFSREGTRWWRKGYVGSQASQIWLFDKENEEFTQVLNDPRGCRSPLWKPDGSGFYYVGAESGTFNLREYDFETNKTKQLTQYEDDSVVQPAISRDGKTIVFRHLFDLYSYATNGKKPPRKINVHLAGDQPSEGTIRRTLTSATNVAFSPDGLEIVFAAGGDLWAMDTVLKEPVAVTQTAVDEYEPVMIEDGAAVLFLKDVAGQVDIYRAEPKEKEKYWWLNSEFEVKQITNDAQTERNLQLSPDGKHFAVVRGLGDLWLMKLDGTPVRQLTSGFDSPQYDFSPDGKWIVYSQEDDDFNDEVWIVPVDGSQEPFNVSRHPDDDVSPVWSPDGKRIAFLGRRDGEETDIYYLFLNPQDDEETSRDRQLKKALDKLKAARPNKPTPQPEKTVEQKKTEGENAPANKETAPAEKKPASGLPEVKIDFTDLHERLHRVSIPNVSERGLFWLGDGKTLAFTATINGSLGTYTIEVNERLTPRKLTSSTGGLVQALKTKSKVAWLSSGKPATLSDKGAVESYSFSVKQEFQLSDRFQAGFDVAWRLMRDYWYDDNLNNRNWSKIRRKYSDAAANASDHLELGEIVSLMLGELNGSHLGFYPRSYVSKSSPAWTNKTAHLGVRFDPAYQGPGLKVRDVVLNGPADQSSSEIKEGEVILSIDGVAVDPAIDLPQLLNGRLDRDIQLSVQGENQEERLVTIRPTTYSRVRSLLYPQFEEETRQRVEELSNGKLGYIHIQGMNMSSFREFERQLYNVGYGKQGLVIDVRENGGGFTTDHMLTALTQPRHAITVPRGGGRGYPHDRKIYASWNKPIVVLCNQNSFSNAEIFSHAIKHLKRGKLVGVTTAGGVISTGAASVMDLGTLRQPFRGWFLPDGEDMELNGAQPHVEIWPLPGELPAGIDRQLEKAVELLKKDVRKYQKKPEPKLQKAAEREKQPAAP